MRGGEAEVEERELAEVEEREPLVRLLVGDDEASVAASEALMGGAAHVVWDGTWPAERYAHTCAIRLRHTRRTGVETLGPERAVRLLGPHGRPVRLGQITAADGAWIHLLFLTEDGGALVARTGVRRATGSPP